MSTELIFEIFFATLETVYMVTISGGVAVLVGIPLGIFLLITQHRQLYYRPFYFKVTSTLINVIRSIPFVIFMVMCIPITRWIVGTSIGTTAAIIPLSLAAIPFIARLIEGNLSEISRGLIEAGLSMGATTFQIVRYVFLREALPSMIQSITMTLINLVAYSAMAGAIGGGGLGDLAIRYGYHRFDTRVMLLTVVLLMGTVQCIQYLGDYFSKKTAYPQ